MPVGDWAAAAIAVLVMFVGGLAWLVGEVMGRRRSERMETYLRLEREAGVDRGQRSARQIMRVLGMTASQVIDAARRSPAIKRLATIANTPSAESTVFEFAPLGAQGRSAA